jgi:hypothetical protein
MTRKPEQACATDTGKGNQIDENANLANAALLDWVHQARLDAKRNAQPGESSLKQKNPGANDAGWTLAIDLAANLQLRDGSNAGATHQWERIQSLAESTRGKPINLLVKVAEPAPWVKNLPDGPLLRVQEKHEVGTYLINDGHIKLLSKEESRGAEADLNELLKQAASRPGKLGLIIQSHGGGVDGLETDNGAIPLASLTESIEKSLTGTARSKLDLLDFDSCMMGQMEVLDRIAPLARQVLASSDVECAKPGIMDGQNLKAALSDLISNPAMTANDLADDFVRRARNGANGLPEVQLYRHIKGGTDTLAHYDMGQLDQMDLAIDKLGQALSECAKNPADRDKIKEIFEKARPIPEPVVYVWPYKIEQKDLKQLTEALQENVLSGAIHDSAGQLTSALENVYTAQSKLVKSHYGDRISGLVSSGGLGIFAPDSTLTSLPAVSRDDLKLAQLSYICTSLVTNAEVAKHMDFIRPLLKKRVIDCESDLLKINTPESAKLIESLEKQVSEFERAEGTSEQKAAIAGLKKVLDEQVSPQLLDDLLKQQTEKNKELVNQVFLKRSLKNAPHWNQFVQSLKST